MSRVDTYNREMARLKHAEATLDRDISRNRARGSESTSTCCQEARERHEDRLPFESAQLSALG